MEKVLSIVEDQILRERIKVEDYKAYRDFKAKVSIAAFGSYHVGYKECRNLVKDLY